MFRGEVYTDAGATAINNAGDDITKEIKTVSNVDTANVGTYYVEYKIIDPVGNLVTKKVREVVVVELEDKVNSIINSPEVNAFYKNNLQLVDISNITTSLQCQLKGILCMKLK